MRWFLLMAAALLAACTARPPAASPKPRTPVTILIGIDGFRADYLDRRITPVLWRLAAEGARGTMRPSFPSKTFPNFYTLVTGMRPDRHGIVANRFEDPAHPGESFSQKSHEPHWWNGGEPVWVAAERAGVRSAMLFWPGDSRVIRSVRPSDWRPYEMAATGQQRVDIVTDWLRRPTTNRPRLIGVYFDTVDTIGHKFGPDAAETRAALAEVDALIGRLVTELAAMEQPANLIIVADHGMGESSPDRRIRIDRIADPRDYRLIEQGPYAAIEPMPGREGALATALLRPHPHMDCWRRANIPARFAYGRNPRTPAFLCLAQTGWMIADTPHAPDAGLGEHGWDPYASEMAALFVAHGPAFARGVTLPAFDSIHVAPLLRQLAEVPQATDADGDAAVLAPALKR